MLCLSKFSDLLSTNCLKFRIFILLGSSCLLLKEKYWRLPPHQNFLPNRAAWKLGSLGTSVSSPVIYFSIHPIEIEIESGVKQFISRCKFGLIRKARQVIPRVISLIILLFSIQGNVIFLVA